MKRVYVKTIKKNKNPIKDGWLKWKRKCHQIRKEL